MSWGFQDLINSGIILRFCSVNIAFWISKWNSFSQKGFTQVEQVQISPDAEARTILTLVYQLWGHQF